MQESVQQIFCRNCGGGNPPDALRCMWCGAPFANYYGQPAPVPMPPPQLKEDSTRRNLGISGAVTLAVGVFMPILQVPIFGAVNYIGNGQGDGAIVLVLAAISALLVLTGRYRWLLVTALISFAALVYVYIKVKDDPNISLSWGFVVLLAGIGLLTSAGLAKPQYVST